MKKNLFLIVLIALLSCNDNKINHKKIDYVSVSKKDIEEEVQEIDENIQEIGNLYQPERMEQEKIKKNNGKNDYQYTLTNSDLLDTDLQDLKSHSRKIVENYYKFLIRINTPFNYDRIIVKIVHRNGKVDIFNYTESEMQEITK